MQCSNKLGLRNFADSHVKLVPHLLPYLIDRPKSYEQKLLLLWNYCPQTVWSLSTIMSPLGSLCKFNLSEDIGQAGMKRLVPYRPFYETSQTGT